LRGNNESIDLIESDFRQVDFAQLGQFNVYFFDGPHQERDHFDGLRLALPAMDERFVFIVDDWNWSLVRSGTLSAIDQLGLSVEFSISIRTTLDGNHPDHDFRNLLSRSSCGRPLAANLRQPQRSAIPRSDLGTE
jgi:hypothetical protein